MDSSQQDSWLNKRLEAWSAARNPRGPSTVLNRKNILIVPTGQGFLFVLATLVVFIAAINYENSLAFGLAFMMVSLFVVSMFHGFNNLNGLRLSALPSSPVFCGEDAAFQVQLGREGKRAHEALELYFRGSTVSRADLVEYQQEQVSVFSLTSRRGHYQAPCLYIRSRFPSGLFTAWSLVNLPLHCLVYPKPVPVSLGQVLNASNSAQESELIREGSEDFYGFRRFTPSDSLKQVAWKNFARGQGMLVKQFVDYLDERLWLDWDMFYGFSDEERLSRLCYCALKLAATNTAYGLKLPGSELAPDTGKQHRLKVLQALAMYRMPVTQGEGEGKEEGNQAWK
jgi:uncharacterized protein (DUF58 family)